MTNRIGLASLAILFPLWGTGCDSTPVTPLPSVQETLADSVQLAPGDQISAGGLLLTFMEATDDSRCPVDVTCIWQGTAMVHITLAPAAGAGTAEVLNPFDRAFVDFSGYRVTLLGLLPVPREGVAIDPQDYRASFRVERLESQ